jgi:hypothetical protein
MVALKKNGFILATNFYQKKTMKQLILFLFMGISIWSHAQPDKGNFLVSGSLTYNHLNRKSNVSLFRVVRLFLQIM